MKKILAGLIGAVALAMSAPASAADLAPRSYTKAPPVATVAYDWSGFYIGINGGGGSAHSCRLAITDAGFPIVPPIAEGCHDATGGTVGGQVGYRWQTANWVFGLEGQGNWADFSGENIGLFTGFRHRTRFDAFGLITGQVGYAWNNVLLFVKGGAAVVREKEDILEGVPAAVFASASETRWAGTAGAGLEVGLGANWSLGAEYDHIFLGQRDVNFITTPANPFGAGLLFGGYRIRQDVDMGLIRLNYRFGGPVVAKY